jgi:hypothetical protein
VLSLRHSSRVVVVWACVCAGCGQGGDHAADEASDDAGDEAPIAACETDTRDDTYVLGLSKQGEHIHVEFVEASPAPPIRGDNRWVVAVSEMGTHAALADCEGDAVPWMRDHMHGTSIEAHVTAGATPGEYIIDPVNMFMPSLWDVTLSFACPGEQRDEVVFSFCVDP